MIHSPATVLHDYLIEQGTFGDPDASSLVWPLYISYMPDDQGINDVGAIYDVDKVKDGRHMAGDNVFHHIIQIRIRSQIFPDGWTKTEAVRAKLESVLRTVAIVDGTPYTLQNISQEGGPFYLGLEEGTKRRHLFSMNFLATIL